MKIYENIIIGSGPVGNHAFRKIKHNTLLITGETKKKIKTNKIHPKIKVILENKTNKFSDLIYSKKNNFAIYSSSEIGGLTNYWGKQFFEYNENEIWPNSIFKNYKSYRKNLDIIEKIYPSTKIQILKKKNFNNLTLSKFTPPIVKSDIVNRHKFKKNKKNVIIADRVISFKKIKKNLIKIFTQESYYFCRNIILCAGPVGNSLILLRSFKEIRNINFKDDYPRLIFGIKTSKSNNINLREDLSDFEILNYNKSIIYGTIFKFNPEHFNLFMRPLIKVFKKILSKFFFYGIYWTTGEYNKIKLSLKKQKIYLSGKTFNIKKDKTKTINNLSEMGYRILKVWTLNFAYGFHYHSLMINFKGKNLSINNFLTKVGYAKNIQCFDSSVINKISNKPPTKTYLAVANYLIDRFLTKQKSK